MESRKIIGMKNFDYFEPKSVTDVLALLAEYGEKATVFAGGTDLIPQMKKGLISPSCLINIARICGLRKIEEGQEGLKIGPMVPLSLLERDSLLSSQLEETLKGRRITQDLLRDCSEQTPEEALQKSRSGKIDAFTRKMIVRLVYRGLSEVSQQT